MAKVSISIRGRTYSIACEDGEEARVLELAAALDAEVTDLGSALGGLGESHLLVITGLSLIDRINDIRAEAAAGASDRQNTDGAAEDRITEIQTKAEEDRQTFEADRVDLQRALDAERARVAALEKEIVAAAEKIDAIAAQVAEA